MSLYERRARQSLDSFKALQSRVKKRYRGFDELNGLEVATCGAVAVRLRNLMHETLRSFTELSLMSKFSSRRAFEMRRLW
jgi:hypothetical protein